MTKLSDDQSDVRPVETDQLVEHFFRHQSANLISVLTRAFGFGKLDLIEDMVQSAMLTAMNSWKKNGIPDNPAAWIHRVARNRLLDVLRREKIHQTALSHAGVSDELTDTLVDQWLEDDEIADSLLRMMFACCHPLLDRISQIALTLKILCGFSIDEIARGLLMNAESVKKRIQRAKQKLSSAAVSLEFPPAADQAERLDAVNDVLYLLFNEGYSTSKGVHPIRDDVCEEAARLCHLLCQHPRLSTPKTKALMALMLFHASRFESRIDEHGGVVLLSDQDRSKWDQNLIRIAEIWLARSKDQQPSRFHFEAAIAQQHCKAPDLESTQWDIIVKLYDRLLELNDSAIYRLNRAIAIAIHGDLAKAFAEIDIVKSKFNSANYPLVDCVSAAIHELDGNPQAAIDDYLRALSRTTVKHERQLIERKLSRLQQQTTETTLD